LTDSNSLITLPDDESRSIVGNTAEDVENIQKLISYLDDPELRNKYSADQSTLQTMVVNPTQTQS